MTTVMNKLLRVFVLVVAGIFAAPGAGAAWTDASSTGIQVASVVGNPRGVAVHAGLHLAVVANQDADSVSLIDLVTGNTVATVTVAAKPRYIVVDSAKSIAYVLHNSGTVSVIDLNAKTRTAQWTLGVKTVGPLLRENGAELLLADTAGKRLLRVSTANGSLLQPVALAYEPQVLKFTPDEETLLIGTENDGVHLLSASEWTEIGKIALPASVSALAWWPGGSLALAVTDDRNLNLLDTRIQAVVAAIALDSDIQDLAVVNNTVYLATPDPVSLGVVDLAGRQFLGRYALAAEPFGLAVDPNSSQLVMTAPDDDLLFKLNPATAVLTPVVIFDEDIKKLAVSNKSDQAVLLSDKKNAYLLNLVDKSKQAFALPARPGAVAIDADRNLGLIGLGRKQGVRFLDLANHVLLPDSVAFNPKPLAIAVGSALGLGLVVASRNDQLLLIDTKARTLAATLSIPGEFTGVAINNTTGLAYLLNAANDTGEIDILDLGTKTVTGTIALSANPQSIVIDEALHLAVVGIKRQNQLQVIDLSTNKVVQTYATPKHPNALTLNPNTHTVVVAAKNSDQIALLDLTTQTFTPNFYFLERPLQLGVSTRFNQALAISVNSAEVTFVQLPNPVPVLTTLLPPDSPQIPALALIAVGDQFIDGLSRFVLNGQFLATIADITAQRDAVALEIKLVLDAAAFDNKPIQEPQGGQLARRARAIIDRVADLAQRDNNRH